MDASTSDDGCEAGASAIPQPKTREEFVRRYRQRLMPAFCRYFANPGTQDYGNRPYVEIAYVSVMAQLGRYASGISKLYEWLQSYETDQNVGDASVIRGLDEYKLWFAIRARSFLIAYTEEWLRGLGESGSDVLRKLQLGNLSQFFEQMEKFSLFEGPLAELLEQRRDLDREGYRTVPIESATCKYPDEYRPVLLYIYLTNKLLFAYNALRHKEYAQVHAHFVKAYVPLVMNAKLSCVSAIYDNSIANKLRPDALDLQAQILLRDGLARKRDGDIEGARDLLRKAREAALLGRALISGQWQEDSDKKATATRFVEKISITGPLETFESLEGTIKTISDAIDDLD